MPGGPYSMYMRSKRYMDPILPNIPPTHVVKLEGMTPMILRCSFFIYLGPSLYADTTLPQLDITVTCLRRWVHVHHC